MFINCKKYKKMNKRQKETHSAKPRRFYERDKGFDKT